MGYGSKDYTKEEAMTYTQGTPFSKRGYLTFKCKPDVIISRSKLSISEQVEAVMRILPSEDEVYNLIAINAD
jgi:hypothetical protein